MKPYVVLVFLLYTTVTLCQGRIERVTISPTGDPSEIDVEVVMHSPNFSTAYLEEAQVVTNDSIILKLCYLQNLDVIPTTITTDHLITLPQVPADYHFTCEIYFTLDPELECNYLPKELADSASTTFSAPLEDPIVLNVESTALAMLTITPIPGREIITIQGAAIPVQQLTLYNAQGQQVQQKKGGTLPLRMDVSTLPAGVYFLTIEAENAREIKKLIIAR
ncbi:T9SS type A sorting domain-containing protein [Altibacter sp. HG106]|uniref:T9SS type A sorting domain-containing protein n=1 Tax=Altibacter sp. HG106 TaxID=3023937 RepID=UPI0023504D6F|nr:T9SS type A sorting domain-containing protein [Altibacter sp. HG106]MDC7995931.1 T9SS type A sorting domain-containing protein [Altibacter sp. HG106]